MDQPFQQKFELRLFRELDSKKKCRDNAELKPSPDGIHILLDKWKASPDDAVMVGDYFFDLEAGKRAALHTIYVIPVGSFFPVRKQTIV